MIKTFENFLSAEEKEIIHNKLSQPLWSFGHSSQGDPLQTVFWKISNLEKEEFFSTHLMQKIQELTEDKLTIERVYMNGHTACSNGNIHTDSGDSNGRTFLIYCNKEWNPEFGGGTCFLHNNEAISFYPAPYSAIYFQNNIEHFAMPLSRFFNGLRVTLAFKLYKLE